MKITSKGQVTIPQDVRERHGLLPGTEVRFIDDGDTVRLVKATGAHRRGRSLVERMRGRAGTRLTTDEIIADARGRVVPTVLVDANVLLAILIPDPAWEDWSSAALAEAAESSLLAINPIVEDSFLLTQ